MIRMAGERACRQRPPAKRHHLAATMPVGGLSGRLPRPHRADRLDGTLDGTPQAAISPRTTFSVSAGAHSSMKR